ncbi:MAG: PQQ-like beta-propeller repeat protein [Proteobacteria bacterium]|nr:PQQ-like beta-propeller repeat protein [Pseudomonadota bacterium]
MQRQTISAPAISADRVYVNGQDGFYTFSLDLNMHTLNADVSGGVSSPAIADDGTIYAIDRNKQLWAFGT